MAAIGAWNYPLMLGVGSTVPALLAGNAVLYKASEVSPACGAAVAAAAHAAGIHPALLCALPPSRAVGKALAAQPGLGCVILRLHMWFNSLSLALTTSLLHLSALCFTGSRATGRAVARAVAATAARSASGIPPRLLLELGGKDGVYVRADADVERAVRA